MEQKKMVTLKAFLQAGSRQYNEAPNETASEEEEMELIEISTALGKLSKFIEALNNEFLENVEVDVNNL